MCPGCGVVPGGAHHADCPTESEELEPSFRRDSARTLNRSHEGRLQLGIVQHDDGSIERRDWDAPDNWRCADGVLASRVVRACALHPIVFGHATDGWPASEVLMLIRRLDLILEVLEPATPAK